MELPKKLLRRVVKILFKRAFEAILEGLEQPQDCGRPQRLAAEQDAIAAHEILEGAEDAHAPGRADQQRLVEPPEPVAKAR